MVLLLIDHWPDPIQSPPPVPKRPIASLPAIVLLTIVPRVVPVEATPPPLVSRPLARLPTIVEFLIVTEPPLVASPPPEAPVASSELLAVSVLESRITVPR